MKKITKQEEKKIMKNLKLGVKEFNTHYFNVSKNGDLCVSEGNNVYNIHYLAKEYGSPLQIIFPHILESRLKDLIGYFDFFIKSYQYKGKFLYHYPMKVNQNKDIIMSLVSNGANLETTSANELWLLKKTWDEGKFNSKIRVFCNGPKTDEYLDLVDELRIKGMNVVPIIESMDEIDRLAKYKGDIGVRVDLDYEADTHWDKKFDRFGISEKEVLDLPRMKNLKVLHYHSGSQIKTQTSILEGIKCAFSLYVKLQKKNPTLDTLDIGGGMGVPYEKKNFYTGKSVAQKMVKLFYTLSEKYKIKHPNIAVEWGQYVVAPSQITVYKVISEKKIPKANANAWYVVDGSFMNDLKDTWAIKQKWHVVPVNNINKVFQKVWLAGSTCDSDDKYTASGNYVSLPKMREEEDLYLAILDTGAYQDALASHHCLLSLPLKIKVQDNHVKIIKQKETPESIGRLFGWTDDDIKK